MWDSGTKRGARGLRLGQTVQEEKESDTDGGPWRRERAAGQGASREGTYLHLPDWAGNSGLVPPKEGEGLHDGQEVQAHGTLHGYMSIRSRVNVQRTVGWLSISRAQPRSIRRAAHRWRWTAMMLCWTRLAYEVDGARRLEPRDGRHIGEMMAAATAASASANASAGATATAVRQEREKDSRPFLIRQELKTPHSVRPSQGCRGT